MADLRLDKDKAHRIIAQILRDEKKMLPDIANELASQICSRLQAAMAVPTKPGLRRYRMIKSSPGTLEQDDAFATDVGKYIADVDYAVARKLWELVYERGRDLPDDVVL